MRGFDARMPAADDENVESHARIVSQSAAGLMTVRYDDFDSDGNPEFVGYVLAVKFGINNTPNYTSNLRLRGARVLFRRQVSPAPAAASFGDVPSSHPFFQYVEALAASGITAGCGGGNYCPDTPLTRGQMAVFLAKALGLHWPAATP
jgi:S-layer homology domain